MDRQLPYGEGKFFKTESEYLVWIRGALRKSWTRYPPQNEYKNSRRKKAPILDKNGNQEKFKTGKKKGQLKYRYECPCDGCNGTFPASKVQVDHILPAGSLTRLEHIESFVLNLFCDYSNLQLLCKKCHDIKSFMDRYEVSKEEAVIRKQVIAKLKQNTAIQKKELLTLGFNEEQISNPKKREECYDYYLRRNHD